MSEVEPTFAETFPTWKHKLGFVAAVGALTVVTTLAVNLVASGDPLNRVHIQPNTEEPIK